MHLLLLRHPSALTLHSAKLPQDGRLLAQQLSTCVAAPPTDSHVTVDLLPLEQAPVLGAGARQAAPGSRPGCQLGFLEQEWQAGS